jgi:hypothetical protein
MLYLLLFEREREEKKGGWWRELARGLFSKGRHTLLAGACQDFPNL